MKDEYNNNKIMNVPHRHILLSIKNSKRMINISRNRLHNKDTKYPIVKEAAVLLEFTFTDDAYHLLWTDQALSVSQIKS